jgi:hypothetical protein
MSWLERQKNAFAEFDLSALNALGLLLFFSTIAVFFAALFLPYDSAASDDEPGYRGIVLLRGALALVAAVAFFHLVKYLLGVMGLAIYRASKCKPPADRAVNREG